MELKALSLDSTVMKTQPVDAIMDAHGSDTGPSKHGH